MLKKMKTKKVHNKIILDEKTTFIIKEAYKMARTNLIFSLPNSEKKGVVFTSCFPSEGKSTTCINTAISLSQLGKSVLIIDADLRKPTIHNVLKIKNQYGLSSFLCGLSDFKTILNTNIRENLDVITAGYIPPNPSELLASDNMGKLLSILYQHYDYVLIDTPPVNVVTDSQLMNDYIAGSIMIIKENHTTHPAIKQALSSIEMAKGKVIGFIKTSCNATGSKSYKNYKYKYAEKKAEK